MYDQGILSEFFQLYLDALMQKFELCNSLFIQRFLDPDNHISNHSGIVSLKYSFEGS